MGKIFYIMGKSSTGKDTVFKRLQKEKSLGLSTIVSYTTRPIRAGEKDGETYHFIDEKKLARLEKEGRVIEKRSYETVYGLWYYLTVFDVLPHPLEKASCHSQFMELPGMSRQHF